MVDATELSRILQNRRASAGQSPMQVRVLLNLNFNAVLGEIFGRHFYFLNLNFVVDLLGNILYIEL